MVVIRLARYGKKGAPVYALMVADKDARLTGRFIEKLGTYTPGSKAPLQFKQDRYDHWVKLGAQPSDRLKKVISQQAPKA